VKKNMYNSYVATSDAILVQYVVDVIFRT